MNGVTIKNVIGITQPEFGGVKQEVKLKGVCSEKYSAKTIIVA